MVSPPSRLAALGLLLLALAARVDATALDENPVTPEVESVLILDHSNPAFGGRPAPDMARPVIMEDSTLSRAEVFAIIDDGGSTHGNSTTEEAGTSSRHLRKLEVTSQDVARLEAHFNQAMERNVNTINQLYKSGDFKPAPWPSSYWPTYQDGINAQWGTEASPAEKYAKAYGLNVQQFMNTVSSTTGIDSQSSFARACTTSSDCSSLNDGSVCAKRAGRSNGYCVPTWYGICHAWAPAAFMEAEPVCSVTKNGITFRPFDIKALLTQIYDGAGIEVVFTGARYNGPGSSRDEYGRYTDAAERDLGPGFFHIAVTNIMGRFKKSFVVDVNSDAQVWNQPVRSYNIKEFTTMAPNTAAQQYFNVPVYPFNADAKKIAYVKLGFSYINEMVRDGPLVSTGIVDQVTVNQDYTYLLELDAQDKIIGGEWVGASQTRHPDFLWFPKAKPDANLVTSVGLSYKNVQDLLTASVACSTTTPTPTPPVSGGPCGNDQVGPLTCPTGEYCQPWNPSFYQCRRLDAKCGKQEVGVDYYGDDISSLSLLLPEQCCEKCHATSGCKAYTFVNYNSDGKAYCYLKRGTGQKQNKVGAVSATIVSQQETCSTPLWGSCGNAASGATCCKTGNYCQPWDVRNYQCIVTPPQCTRQYTNVDFYGNDISTVYGIGPGECCAKCVNTAGCKAYTYVNDNVDKPACYLKTGTGQQRSHASAVSGLVN